MVLHSETIDFLIFVLVGFIFSIIFDFFRAIRKFKKVKTNTVYIQDIIYFTIIGVILLITITTFLTQTFRIYLLLSIILGVFIYIGVFGNKILKLFIKILSFGDKILQFIFLPIEALIQVYEKQIKKYKKIVVNCCKKTIYMINCNYSSFKKKIKKRIFKLNIKNKRGNIDGKKSC